MELRSIKSDLMFILNYTKRITDFVMSDLIASKESQTYRGRSAMKHSAIFLITIVISLTLLSGQVHADRHYEYEQCLLENMKGLTKHQGWATEHIKRICKENYLNINKPSKKKQEYNQCLINYLFDTESESAAHEVIKTCRGRHL